MHQDEIFVDSRSLGLSKGRFWSSGNQLPVIRVIARVLVDPVDRDLEILIQHFGMDLILDTWQRLKDRNEVAESIVPITEVMLSAIQHDT